MIQANQACERQPLNYIAVSTVLIKQHLNTFLYRSANFMHARLACIMQSACSMLTLHMYAYALISNACIYIYIDAIGTIITWFAGTLREPC